MYLSKNHDRLFTLIYIIHHVFDKSLSSDAFDYTTLCCKRMREGIDLANRAIKTFTGRVRGAVVRKSSETRAMASTSEIR